MAESKVYMFPDGNNTNSSVDPNVLLSMMNGNGGFGNNMWLPWMFMFFLWPLLGNGSFNGFGNMGGLGNMISGNDGRELIMLALGGTDSAIQNLASMFNTTSSTILQAINGVSNAVGLSGLQIINSGLQNTNTISSQLCSATCGIKEGITNANYQNQLNNVNQTYQLGSQINNLAQLVQSAFCTNTYENARQFCETKQAILDQTREIKDATTVQTAAIVAKLDAMETQALQDKISTLENMNGSLRNEINISNQNATIISALAPINTAIATLTLQISALSSDAAATKSAS